MMASHRRFRGSTAVRHVHVDICGTGAYNPLHTAALPAFAGRRLLLDLQTKPEGSAVSRRSHRFARSRKDATMSARPRSRREFLLQSLSGIGAAWAVANDAGIEDAAAYVQQASGAGRAAPTFTFFTPAQAADVEAMAAQIIPTDATPGAREAHVIMFIDRILGTFEKERRSDYTRGLTELAAQTKQSFPSAARFSDLSPDQQIQVLTAIEKTPFFNLVRTHTITGFFASPVHGGNAGKVGWALVHYDDSLHHTPPFGYYDALEGSTNQ
jgi:gluconate 2-dehydrogenase gamma chain